MALVIQLREATPLRVKSTGSGGSGLPGPAPHGHGAGTREGDISGSNSGLLMGSAVTQHPEMYGPPDLPVSGR